MRCERAVSAIEQLSGVSRMSLNNLPDLRYAAMGLASCYFHHLSELHLKKDPTGTMIGVHVAVKRQVRFETSFDCPFHNTTMMTIHPIEIGRGIECRKLQSSDKKCICLIFDDSLRNVLQADVGSTVNTQIIFIHLKRGDTLASAANPYLCAG